MEEEKEYDYPSRKEQDESTKRMYQYLENNYPDIGRTMFGMNLTDSWFITKICKIYSEHGTSNIWVIIF